jgi:hypothetical protein
MLHKIGQIDIAKNAFFSPAQLSWPDLLFGLIFIVQKCAAADPPDMLLPILHL